MILSLLLWTGPLAIFIYLCNQYSLLPRSIPGPLLARFTDLFRLLSVYNRDAHAVQLALHQKYRPQSDLVRLGPNTVSVCGPGYVQQIYGIDKKLPKSNFYATFQNIVNGRRAASLVAVTDELQHARMKRLVAHAYSLSTLVEFEPLVDSTTHIFLDVLKSRFGHGEQCDLGAYLQYYAFDVMGELTFSKRLGFIEQGVDVDNIIASIGANFEYFSVIGQMPWLDDLLGKNPIYVKYFRKNVSSPILKFAQQLLRERLQQLQSETKTEKEKASHRPDFLARFLAAREKIDDKSKSESTPSAPGEDTEPMTDGLLLSLLFGNINAGSDTIATTLRAIIYYLLTNPTTLDLLKHELTTAHAQGTLTLPCPTWSETQSDACPYLRAVIKEGLRLWPALSLPLERVVTDPAGLTLTSTSTSTNPPSSPTVTTTTTTTHLPHGTILGINPYVLHRDPRLFDPNHSGSSTTDVEHWNPARWLPPNPNPHPTTTRHNTPAQLKAMDHALLAFGAGKRSCLGKNIALMELTKLVPALVMAFPDMRLLGSGDTHTADGKRGWTVRNAWVLAQTGLCVRLA